MFVCVLVEMAVEVKVKRGFVYFLVAVVIKSERSRKKVEI
jgi:hypothetical protein